jgi:predicted regulator of Ras-like GTPase activity (Roadblock/LC7/MglB family)
MSLQSELKDLIARTPGAQGACILDANGEVVIDQGVSVERLRLIGAYQAIALSVAHRIAERYEIGAIQQLSGRYEDGAVVLSPLSDGYFLVVVIGRTGNIAHCVERARIAKVAIDADLMS